MQKTERKGFSIFSLALLALLLANCTDFSEDLMRAATRGDTSTVQALLAKGASPNVQGIKDVTALIAAVRKGHPE